MKVTRDTLKQIIKEELEEIVATEAYVQDTIKDALMQILSDFKSREGTQLRKEEVVAKIEFILKNYK